MKEIPLTKGKVATVDDAHYEPLVAMGKWTSHAKGYAYRWCDRRCVLMHQAVLGLAGQSADQEIDHINRDKLDNRLSNLRPATRQQNSANRGPNRNNRSGYKGVSWDNTLERWTAQIKVDGRKQHLGCYDDKIEAARAYDRAAKEHFGEFAYLNLAA